MRLITIVNKAGAPFKSFADEAQRLVDSGDYSPATAEEQAELDAHIAEVAAADRLAKAAAKKVAKTDPKPDPKRDPKTDTESAPAK